MLFAVLTKTFAISKGLIPAELATMRVMGQINLECGLLTSLIGLCEGITLLLTAINTWRLHNFNSLDYARTMRLVIPGATLTALGFQTMFSSFSSVFYGCIGDDTRHQWRDASVVRLARCHSVSIIST